MNSDRAETLSLRERSRDRVRRITRATGVAGAMTGVVLAVGLAAHPQSLTGAVSAPARTASDDDADNVSQPQVVSQPPASAQGPAAATHGGGS